MKICNYLIMLLFLVIILSCTNSNYYYITDPSGRKVKVIQRKSNKSYQLIKIVKVQKENEIITDNFDDFTAPVPVYQIPPDYPVSSRNNRIQGSVVLGVEINIDGTVGEIEIITSVNSDLDKSAIDAVKQWRFKTCTDNNGNNVKCWIQFPVNFVLQ